MAHIYERIEGEEGLPVKTSIHAIEDFQMHWHNEIEILMVLEGSVTVMIGEKVYCLEENDMILINADQLHSTRRTKDENVLLAVQIDPAFYNKIFPDFNKFRFNCKSFDYKEEEQEVFDVIRHHIAEIIWESNKKDLAYKFKVASSLCLLGEHLLSNCEYELREEEDKELRDTNLERIKRITGYVKENFKNKITLKEIAKNEHLNYYYLSHFIKEKLGMSFQEYLNIVRLDYAVRMLATTDETIIDVSGSSGFPNINSFNNLFKTTYEQTPTEFRKNHYYKVDRVSKKSKTYLDVDRHAALTKLFSYLRTKNTEEGKKNVRKSIESIHVDSKKEGGYLKNHWQNLITFGRAHEGIRADWQKQFTGMQKEIGFHYTRFHGIFMDEMMVYNLSPEGMVEYNWTYVDQLFDFFMVNGIKPFVELGFMPDDLKRSEETVFWWAANISPPKDIDLWKDLVENFIKHCIQRYGLKEVKTWYFEVWNEPEFQNVFWAGTQEEYFDFYKETAFAIKSISKDLKVGGPSVTHGSIVGSSWLDEFMEFCKEQKIPLDFLSLHIYPEYIPEDSVKEAYQLLESGVDSREVTRALKKIYHESDHVTNTINLVNEKIENILNKKIEVHITEWNVSSQWGNFIHDTSYVATYIIRNALETIDKVDSLGYWTLTDLMEEHKLGISHFHGGFGLINKDGLKKPSYYAYYLLSKLGNEIIHQEEGFIVTMQGEDLQILAYNHAHFDELFMTGDTSHINHKERYSMYKTKEEKQINLHLSNIEGDYKQTKYSLNRDHGSVFDEWTKIGTLENMSAEEINYLKGKAQPKMVVKDLKLKGHHKILLRVPVHGVEMILLERR